MDSPTVHVGKQVGDFLYVHLSLLPGLPQELRQRLHQAIDLAKLEPGLDFNGIRFSLEKEKYSLLLLCYNDLEREPFPVLQQSWLVHLSSREVDFQDYRQSDDPPILHRKELLLPADHPQRDTFARLTADLEAANLFTDAACIGTRQPWEDHLGESGYALEGHRLVRLDAMPEIPGQQIPRHRTAISKAGLSAPMRALARHGYLDGHYTVLDYGCGRGDDLRYLEDRGVEAQGWDPYYAPNIPLVPADVVSLGYVINIIEDRQERIHTVQRAFALCQKVLAVTVPLHSASSEQGQTLGDGILTRWHTFQKYYSQQELCSFLQECLGRRATSIAPGVSFVFKNELKEQNSLS